MEVNETIQITLELKNPDGTSRVETALFRYNCISQQNAQDACINVNCSDLADLVEKVGAPNFEFIGVKLQVNLTLSNGVEKVGEVILPENVIQASPAQLKEMVNQAHYQMNIKPVNYHNQINE